MKKHCLSLLTLSMLTAGTAQASSLSGNFWASNNYLWRGLTQSQNETVVGGGIDYAFDNGMYVGTWATTVSYAPGDAFSYEHDMYFGFSGEVGSVTYDISYLYYNYDDAAEFDFSELVGSVSFMGFELGAYILVDTEAQEGPGQDFGFSEATYIYTNYSTEVGNGLELTLHIGQHQGDFNEAFNGVPGDYIDYSFSVAKSGFTFMISDTDLEDAGADGLDNDELKVAVSYTQSFDF